MTDEQYVFKETEKERKRNARGAHNKKRGGGRYVKTPSDYLSKKERLAMNGECSTFKMNDPVKWETFKQWPTDIRAKYINGLRENYGATSKMIAEMMGVNYITIYRQARALGLELEPGAQLPRGEKMQAWRDFVDGAKTPVEDVSIEAPVVIPVKEETPLSANMVDVGKLLEALKGTGAQVTITFTL